MRNELVTRAAQVANAINALRLHRHRLFGTHEGVEIHQPGKPVLLLTYAAAAQWAQEIEEAE